MLPMMIKVEESERFVEWKESEEVGRELVQEKEPEESESGGEGVEGPKEKELNMYSRGTWSKRKTREPLMTTASPPLLSILLSDDDSAIQVMLLIYPLLNQMI